MDFDIPEIVNLSLKAVGALLVILGLADTVVAWLLAFSRGEFSMAYAGHWLASHVPVWFSIFILAVIGKGVPTLEIPPIGGFALAATVGLVSYAVVVLKSLQESSRTTVPGVVDSTKSAV